MGLELDSVKFHLVDLPLINTNDHNVISFGIHVDRGTKPASDARFLPIKLRER